MRARPKMQVQKNNTPFFGSAAGRRPVKFPILNHSVRFVILFLSVSRKELREINYFFCYNVNVERKGIINELDCKCTRTVNKLNEGGYVYLPNPALKSYRCRTLDSLGGIL
jgi:hypothetical protein